MGTGECVMNFSLNTREQHSGPEKSKLCTGLVTVKQCLATHTLKLVSGQRPSNEVF